MINSVALTGRLTADVDMRSTQSGKAVGQFNLAVNRQFTNSNGEREADFIRCVVWGKQAENLAKFVSKGSLLGVEGRLQTRSYENKQNQKVYITEVILNSFALLQSSKENQTNNQSNSNSSSGNSNNNQKTSNNHYDDPYADSVPVDISDDDLPF